MFLKQMAKEKKKEDLSLRKKQKKNKTVLQKRTVSQMKLKLEGKWFK